MLKAIETEYKGYKFRSRLEARWAVFFDALGIEWEYEKEGYDLDGVYYLPDFYLPGQDSWLEIKGGLDKTEVFNDALAKVRLLAKATEKNTFLFGEIGDHPRGVCVGNLKNCWAGWDENYPELWQELFHLILANQFEECFLIKPNTPNLIELTLSSQEVPCLTHEVYTLPENCMGDFLMLHNREGFFKPILTDVLRSCVNDGEFVGLFNSSLRTALMIGPGGYLETAGTVFGEDIFCNSWGLAPIFGTYTKFCQCTMRSISYFAPEKAVAAARQARFEHGEKPFVRGPKKR